LGIELRRARSSPKTLRDDVPDVVPRVCGRARVRYAPVPFCGANNVGCHAGFGLGQWRGVEDEGDGLVGMTRWSFCATGMLFPVAVVNQSLFR
jgi:hypothetical protein